MKFAILGFLLLIGCTQNYQQVLYKNLKSGVKLCYMIAGNADAYYDCVDRMFKPVEKKD